MRALVCPRFRPLALCGSLILAGITLRAESVDYTVHVDRTTATVSEGIYGQFLEHIFNSVHGGLWGDQILNGMLEDAPPSPWARAEEKAAAESAAPTPLNWELLNGATLDGDTPLNAKFAALLPASGAALRQSHLDLKAGETYTLGLYLRGEGDVEVLIEADGLTPISETVKAPGKDRQGNADWRQRLVKFTAPSATSEATLTLRSASTEPLRVEQVSLFSASALATGGYRPDLLKAVADLRPMSMRWPGGSFVSFYNWQDAIGPRERRSPHPIVQWDDRDTYQFGTDEFIQFCELVGAEPILVLNTRRGVEDALDWLEYCLGDTTTEWGARRAANGHPEPYELKTLEIDNETWRMGFERYRDVVIEFCTAIRARYPELKLSVVGSYGYETPRGQGWEVDWDPRLIAQAGTTFDLLSPHYYNGIFVADDYAEDPYRYEDYLATRADLIRQSDNPDMKIYVSEWNLTVHERGNDWRMGLYAGGLLNGFERQADIVTMSCPALFMRRLGVTTQWDNALINFDQTTWYPGSTYVVMKLWRDAYAPHLLAVDGPTHPLNFVATRSADGLTTILKAVNPTEQPIIANIQLEGGVLPAQADVQVVAPGSLDARNSLAEPRAITAVPGTAKLAGRTVTFTLPALSAAVVKLTP